jgi:hypothetical protein
LKYIDNRNDRIYVDVGDPMIAFQYDNIPPKDEWEPSEYGIHTNKGFTISVKEDELINILEMIKIIKERKK